MNTPNFEDPSEEIEYVKSELRVFILSQGNALGKKLMQAEAEEVVIRYLIGEIVSCFGAITKPIDTEKLMDKKYMANLKVVIHKMLSNIETILFDPAVPSPDARMMNATNFVIIIRKKLLLYPELISNSMAFWDSWLKALDTALACEDCELLQPVSGENSLAEIKGYRKSFKTELFKRTEAIDYNPTLRNQLLASVDAACNMRSYNDPAKYLNAINEELKKLGNKIFNILTRSEDLNFVEG